MAIKRFYKFIKRFRPEIRQDIQNIATALLTNPYSRKLINTLYGRLTINQASFVHVHFSQMFTELSNSFHEGLWKVNFASKKILMPLRSNGLSLDWNLAVSILGHDNDIKKTYEYLIQSNLCPDLFVDVGANYGTHSLIFLIHRIETLSFEPNDLCQEYFRELCAINQVEPQIIDVALSDREGFTELVFPKNKTWMGTTNSNTREQIEPGAELLSQKVKKETLDSYLDAYKKRQVLIKIDTEGSEYLVLQGAVNSIEKHRPLIIFESFPDSRHELINFFMSVNYKLALLPWFNDKAASELGKSAFVNSSATNFIAVPLGKIYLNNGVC